MIIINEWEERTANEVTLSNRKYEYFKSLEQENKQLKEKLDCDLQWAFKYDKLVGNWNKLKEYLKGFDIEYLNEVMEHNLSNTLENILNKMQEIEQGSDSNE